MTETTKTAWSLTDHMAPAVKKTRRMRETYLKMARISRNDQYPWFDRGSMEYHNTILHQVYPELLPSLQSWDKPIMSDEVFWFVTSDTEGLVFTGYKGKERQYTELPRKCCVRRFRATRKYLGPDDRPQVMTLHYRELELEEALELCREYSKARNRLEAKVRGHVSGFEFLLLFEPGDYRWHKVQGMGGPIGNGLLHAINPDWGNLSKPIDDRMREDLLGRVRRTLDADKELLIWADEDNPDPSKRMELAQPRAVLDVKAV